MCGTTKGFWFVTLTLFGHVYLFLMCVNGVSVLSGHSRIFKYTQKGSEDDLTLIYSKHTLISLCPRVYTQLWSSPLFPFFGVTVCLYLL